MFEIWKYSVPFYAAWLLAAYLLNRRTIRAIRETPARGSAPRLPGRVTQILFGFSPAVLSSWMCLSGRGGAVEAYEFWRAAALLCGGFVVPHMVASSLSVLLARQMQSRGRAQYSPGELRRVLFSVVISGGATGAVVLFPFTALSPYDAVRAAAVILALGGVFLTLAGLAFVRRFVGTGLPAVPVPMEESPLHGELVRLSSFFGRENATWTVVPVRTGDKGEKLTPADVVREVNVWWQKFRARRPSVLLPLLQRIEPSAVSAALAVRLARSHRPRRKRFYARPAFWRTMGVWTLFFGFAIAVGWTLPGNVNPRIRQFLVSLVVLAPVTAVVWRLHGVGGGAEVFHAAFDAWRYATPGEDRTAVQFVHALREFDQLLHYQLTAAEVANLHRANRHLMKFLNSFGEGVREQALALDTSPESNKAPVE
ncbi:hypothetical protein HZA57_07840 [Candidatus Poribacteria bacterium]|nr:hypothetical protein [Candidatus Poribacteria bacterium]